MAEIPKAYEPKTVEEKWYQFWLDHNCFVADPARVSEKRPAYSIVIPPPNVTGVLTMGHVLNNTIQDILARKARMEGKEVLWLPGTDHAGIATEGVVMRQLRKEEQKTKQDVGREEFLKRVWAWQEKHGGIILKQLRALGASCDWTRTRFTMDEHYVRCVQKVFVELYQKGLIYRGKRMVNWDPAARTAVSDEEVTMVEEKGHLWHIKYPVLDPRGRPRADEAVIVATTRPETMLGDEAVAVNPNDPRYTHFIGKELLLPLQNKPIPVIADELVDPKFGTGCVKVTPAHDPADYEMAMRHNLPLTVVIGPDGTMTDLAGEEFAGLDRLECRAAVVEDLQEQGLLVKIEDYLHNVGYSERSHVPIEPYLSEQWFLKYPSVAKARECVQQEGSARVSRADSGVSPESSVVRAGEVASGETPDAARGTRALPEKMRFHPERWAKVYDHWMTHIRDWCISRQLWWGHRVPVWRKSYSKEEFVNYWAKLGNPERPATVTVERLSAQSVWDILAEKGELGCDEQLPDRSWRADRAEKWQKVDDGTVVQEFATYSTTEAENLERLGYIQDSDVLDTWFSSWLWPFATMGWTGDPETDANNATLRAFYPTSDLVTGPDIIFFWVARMIMAGYEFMGDRPFRNVYFTGIIRDKLGRKMSKSLGNSPDPLDLIARYGADALRFGTMRSAPLGQDILFDEQNVELGRNFCNKLWNACRFRQMHGGEVQGEIEPGQLRSDDKWILLKLDQAIREITDALATYNFSQAAQTLYRFFWAEYCDWYVETTKPVLGRPVEPFTREGVEPRAGAASASAATLQPLNAATTGSDTRKANVLAVIDFVLSHTLRLFHPFLPFITEELWHSMGYHQDMPPEQGAGSIMFAPWPKPLSADERDFYGLDECYLELAAAKFELVTLGRNLRSEANIPSNKKLRFILKPAVNLSTNDVEVMRTLLNAETLEVSPEYQQGKATVTTHTPLGELYLPLEGLMDVAAEKKRLQKELEKIAGELSKIDQKLNNPQFVQKVPAQVLEEHQKRRAEWLAKQAHAHKTLDLLATL